MVKQSSKTATARYMHNNAEKVEESRKQATALYRKSNPEKVKQSSKTTTARYMYNNPEKVEESRKRATVLYRKSNQRLPVFSSDVEISSSLAAKWKLWIEDFEMFILASGITDPKRIIKLDTASEKYFVSYKKQAKALIIII